MANIFEDIYNSLKNAFQKNTSQNVPTTQRERDALESQKKVQTVNSVGQGITNAAQGIANAYKENVLKNDTVNKVMNTLGFATKEDIASGKVQQSNFIKNQKNDIYAGLEKLGIARKSKVDSGDVEVDPFYKQYSEAKKDIVNKGMGVLGFTPKEEKNKQDTEELLSGKESQGYKLDENDYKKIGGVVIDKNTGKQADANYVNGLYESFAKEQDFINSNIEKLNSDYKSGLVSDGDYRRLYSQYEAEWNAMTDKYKELNNYEYRTGNDYYQWLKQNGTEDEIKKFEAYVGSFNDSYLESLANSADAAVTDFVATPFEVYDMIKSLAGDESAMLDPDSVSYQLSERADELRSFTLNGKNDEGLRAYSLQTISSMMPMVLDMVVFTATGGALGWQGKALQVGVSTLTNIQMGANSAYDTVRQRLDEGNQFGTSFYNGVAHGFVTGAVEAWEVGNVVSITNLLTGGGGTVLGVGLLALPRLAAAGWELFQSGAGEAVEEMAEQQADHLIDRFTNAILDWSGSDERIQETDSVFERETWGGVGEGGMTDSCIMAFAGAVIMETPNIVQGSVKSVKNYNAAGEAKVFWQAAQTYFQNNGDIKNAQMAQSVIDLIDQERADFKRKNPYSDAIVKASDKAAPAPSLDEVLNITANAFKLDVADSYQMAEQNKQKAMSVLNTLQDEMANRGYTKVNENGETLGVTLDTYLKMDYDTRTETKKALDYANRLNADVKVADEEYLNKLLDKGIDPGMVNGAHFDENGRIILNPFSNDVKEKGASILTSTLAHELTHKAQSSKLYNQLENMVKNALGEEYETRLAEIRQQYQGIVNSEEGFRQELVAKYIEDHLGNEQFLKRLANYNESFFSRILEGMRSILETSPESQVAQAFFEVYSKIESEINGDNLQPQYSVDNEMQYQENIDAREELNNTIDEILKGNKPEGNQVVYAKTPQLLLDLGAVDAQLIMSPNEITKAVLSKEEAEKLGYKMKENNEYHQLGKEGFNQVLDNISDPVFVIRENNNKLVVFTECFDYKNRQVITPILIDVESYYKNKRGQYNVMLSAHGRSSINNYINKLLNNGGTIVYQNKKKIQSLIDGGKVQYQDSIFSVSNNSFSLSDQNVNNQANREVLNELDAQGIPYTADNDGNITLYHRTSQEAANEILRTGKMKTSEDGLFFSTAREGSNNTGYGDAVVELKVPAGKLEVNDLFGDEASMRLPTGNSREVDVSEYLTDNTIPTNGQNMQFSVSSTQEMLDHGIDLDTNVYIEEAGDSSRYLNSSIKLNLRDIVHSGLDNINKTFDNSERVATIESNGAKVKCTTEGMKHGIHDLSKDSHRVSAFVVEHADVAFKNAKKINEVNPTPNHPKGQDVYLSIVKDTKGNLYPTRIIVDKASSQLLDLSVVDKLYAMKSFKKDVGSPRGPAITGTTSNFTLNDLSELVKDNYGDTLPQIVLDDLNMERPDTELGRNVMFSLSDQNASWESKTKSVLDEANNISGDEQLTVDDISDILHQRKVNPRVIEAMQRSERVFKENIPLWVPGYDTLRAQYPNFSEGAFNDALYEILSYGEMDQETRFKLHKNLLSEFDFVYPENIDSVNDEINKELNEFINDALETFSNDAKYRAGEVDTDTVKKAIKVNEAYGGKDIEGEFNKRQYGAWINELSKKTKMDMQAEYQPLTDQLINNDKTLRETKGRPSDRKISHLKTFDQNLKALAGGNVEVYNALRDKLRYGLLDQAAATISQTKTEAQSEVIDKIRDLGITQGTKEDIATQYILEGHTEEWIGDEPGAKNGFKAYTEEDLKKSFDYEMANGKKAYENILNAANIIRQSYMDLYEKITMTQLIANGDVEGNAEVEVAEAKTKVEQAWNTLKNIQDEIVRNGSKESTQAAYEIQKRKYNTLVKTYNTLVEKQSSGDLTRRQLTPFREDYSHHIQKRSLRNTFNSIRSTDFAVPTELAGTSDYTNPNTAFSTISMAQDGHKYDPTALGSYASYVNEAANLIGYNPVILELRQFNKDIKNTAQGTTLNKFSEYLNDYANMLAGKRNAIDRGVQKIVGAKTMKTIQALNSYAKGAALAMNFRSGLVQFANIPNGLGILQQRGGNSYVGDVAKGMRDYAAAMGKDSIIDQSAFLSNRFFDFDTGEKGFGKKFNDISGKILSIGDKVGAEVIWWSAYEQGQRLGEANPVLYADDVTRSAIAGRTKEDMSLAAQSQVLNLLFPFQVENVNLFNTIMDQASNKNFGSLLTYGVAAFVFNSIIKGITNGDDEILPEFITPIYEELKKALNGEIEGDDVAQNILLGELAEFLSLLPAGSSATQLIFGDESETVFGDYNPNRYGITNIGVSGVGNLIKDLVEHKDDQTQQAIDVIDNIVGGYLPGGKQLTRTVKGIESMGGLPEYKNGQFETSPVNYTKSGKIAYVNDQENIADWIRAALFGKWSTSEAQNYIGNDFKSLSTSAGNVFDMLQQSGDGNAYENYTAAKDFQANKKQASDDKKNGVDSDTETLREQLIASGKYDDYMKEVTKAYESYLDEFDYTSDDKPKSFTQFANSYGISSEDLKQDAFQDFYDTYKIDKDTQEVFSKAMDIENVKNANGKTINSSGATLRRLEYENAGIYDQVIEYIEKNGLEYSDFGLNKTVVGYNSYQMNNMLKRINEINGTDYVYGNGKGSSKSSKKKSSGSRKKSGKSSSTTEGGLTLQQKRALIQYAKALGGGSSSNVFSGLDNILKTATSIEDAKKKAKEIRKKYS